jgi:hypothetical protein
MFLYYITQRKDGLNYSLHTGKNKGLIGIFKEFYKTCETFGLNKKGLKYKLVKTSDNESIYFSVKLNDSVLTLELKTITLEIAKRCKSQAYGWYMYEESAGFDYDINKSRKAFSDYCEWMQIEENLLKESKLTA